MSLFERTICLAVLSFGSMFFMSFVLGAFAAIAWIGSQFGFNAVMWLAK